MFFSIHPSLWSSDKTSSWKHVWKTETTITSVNSGVNEQKKLTGEYMPPFLPSYFPIIVSYIRRRTKVHLKFFILFHDIIIIVSISYYWMIQVRKKKIWNTYFIWTRVLNIEFGGKLLHDLHIYRTPHEDLSIVISLDVVIKIIKICFYKARSDKK